MAYPAYLTTVKIQDRVLKRGGAFAAWSYDWFEVNPDIDKAVKESVLNKILDYWAPQNQILWNGYRSVSFPYKKIDTPSLC